MPKNTILACDVNTSLALDHDYSDAVYSDMEEDAPNRIAELRKAKGWTQEHLARACDPPTTQPQIKRLESGERALNQKWLNVLSKALGVGLADLLPKPEGYAKHVTVTPQLVAPPNEGGLEFLGEEGARRFHGPKNLPIVGYVKAGADGLFYDQGTVQGVTMRPEALLHVKAAYAVRVQDMSMFPAYEPNDLVYVNPTLAVVPDSNVVIQLLDGQAFVKRLVRRTEKFVICKEWYPEAREIKYDTKQVQFIHMIVRPK